MTAPVLTAHLFRPLGAELLRLLRGLDADAWLLPTAAGEWRVRDVAAHLLDGDLRRLSAGRDAHRPPAPDRPVRTYHDLVTYLDGLNADWVRASQRLSPRVLLDCLEASVRSLADHMEALDPLADATFPVAWAGHTASPMWLDIGREYTERWHHQDQIREVAGSPPLRDHHLLRPVLDISLLALPHAYRRTAAVEGTRIALHATGAAGGDWYLEHSAGWRLVVGRPSSYECSVSADDLVWARLLLHRLSAADAARAVRVSGATDLAAPLLAARAVMVARRVEAADGRPEPTA